MEERATGIILRTRPLTETSLIVHWLTPEFGRIATVAKGARRPKSTFRGKLDLFYRAEFTFQRSRRSDLHNLREVMLQETHAELRKDMGHLQQASYCANLIEKSTEKETPLAILFELMQGFLQQLTGHPPRPLDLFAFEIKLLNDLGLQPDLEQSKLSPGSRIIFEKCAESDWATLARLKPSEAQTRELQHFLHAYLLYHLDHLPAGRTAALGGE